MWSSKSYSITERYFYWKSRTKKQIENNHSNNNTHIVQDETNEHVFYVVCNYAYKEDTPSDYIHYINILFLQDPVHCHIKEQKNLNIII